MIADDPVDCRPYSHWNYFLYSHNGNVHIFVCISFHRRRNQLHTTQYTHSTWILKLSDQNEELKPKINENLSSTLYCLLIFPSPRFIYIRLNISTLRFQIAIHPHRSFHCSQLLHHHKKLRNNFIRIYCKIFFHAIDSVNPRPNSE